MSLNSHPAAFAEELQQPLLPRSEHHLLARRGNRELPHSLPLLPETFRTILQPRGQVIALASHRIQRRVVERALLLVEFVHREDVM